MSTRGWVTVNVFWLINKEINEEQQKIPFTGTQNLKLSPFASAILAKQERDSAPASVHVSFTSICIMILKKIDLHFLILILYLF